MPNLKSYTSLTHRFIPVCRNPRASDNALVRQARESQSLLTKAGDSDITEKAVQLRNDVMAGVSILNEDVVSRGAALVMEAARRTVGMVHFDTQLLCGMALTTGAVAEMRTGEGKTLAATLPTFLHALKGDGVHVATVNQYLAERDYSQLKPLYELLGLTVGLSEEQAANHVKREAYACDITYATGYELGFDFLRDEVIKRRNAFPKLGETFLTQLRGRDLVGEPPIQRSHAFAIIDEIDSVLIDEATTPLIISDAAQQSGDALVAYRRAHDLAKNLKLGVDFAHETETRRVYLTDRGLKRIHEGVAIPSTGLKRPWQVYVENALKVIHGMKRDVDYVVQDGVVKIVDQNTGRIFDERNWRDGLHQAVEMKEGVDVTDEKRSIARISRQRYFQNYQTLCGMTGTAKGSQREMYGVYGMPIVDIPLRTACKRVEEDTLYFGTADAKLTAISRDVVQKHEKGQPVLVGTPTIEQSQLVAERLRNLGVPHRVLNGKQDEDEAQLIAAAGELGAITIATNMAGRGTDISLSPQARQAGGLHVIGTHRNESLRVDRQLIGRAARMGDPGSGRFYVSAEDQLLETFAPSLVKRMVKLAGQSGTGSAELDREMKKVQEYAERQKYETRCQLMKQELWMDEFLEKVA